MNAIERPPCTRALERSLARKTLFGRDVPGASCHIHPSGRRSSRRKRRKLRTPRALVLLLTILSACYESYPLIDFEDEVPSGDAGLPPRDSGVDGDDSGGSDEEETDAPDPDTPPDCAKASARFITNIVDFEFGPGQNHNQESGFPHALYGPPRANDTNSVVSLGNGGFVIVEFENNIIVDGPGPDFIVFENPVPHFVELATVSVSNDLITWHEFPCTAAQDGPDYGSCAGVGIVRSHPDNGIDPLDPTVAGGDAFDLADINVAEARYVRIQDREDLVGPAGVFDLDAVAIVNALCP